MQNVRLHGERQGELIRLRPTVNMYMKKKVPGSIRNVVFKNVALTGEDGGYLVELAGADAAHDVRNVRFENVSILGTKLTHDWPRLKIGKYVEGVEFVNPKYAVGAMHAEILAIGDEITSGQTLDTNSQWLSQRLEELGVRVLYHTTVGDELAPCAEVFRQAIDRADLVVATGGLGPTADDLTRQALAQATGRELQLDPEALEHIRGMFARRGRPMPPQNELQAMFPAGSRVVRNPHGTAPGIDLEVPRERPRPRVPRVLSARACPPK